MILTVEDLKSKYGISVSNLDQLEILLETAEEECLSYAGLTSKTVEEFFSGGSRIVALSYRPIREISAVTINGAEAEYRYDERAASITFPFSTPAGIDNIKVVYSTGFEEGKAPAVLKTAIALTVQHLLKINNAKLIGVTNRAVEGGTEQIEQSIPPLAVKNLLQGYKRSISV